MTAIKRLPRALWMVKFSEAYDGKTPGRGKPGVWAPLQGIFTRRWDARLEALCHRAKYGGKTVVVKYGATQRELDRYHRKACAAYAKMKRADRG